MKRIESEQNASVKQWKKLYTKKERDKSGQFIIDGPHLIEEALRHHVPIAHLIVEESYILPKNWDVSALDPWVVPKKIMKMLSDTEHPQGVLAVCRMKEQPLKPRPDGKYLLIDGVQDPGNLGTIIRTADAQGIDGVILGEGTVDVYNSKVLRSTQGSLFHVPVVKGSLDEWIADCKTAGVPVFVSALKGAIPIQEVQSSGSFALVVGNEGSGVRLESIEGADELVYIPMFGNAESLNVAVAAGIMLYELMRNRQ
ncbi:RNA methyltransferase, TrmH family [Fictibacillus enclensis]|uniref:RNA methyltransferase n=1 Tax=Fictibacillus enclensis TaxID=1017270 RepID=A0A0V8J9Q7_9BACL|nr:RNA methyltransferase [Fictibacillus enclensis]KSU83707.1 RNA methyltransferase [Fictibacillus enclensis]SCC19857.1 RNA methyltransferase, TrmH family [Fictibacillus enclensis]